MPVVNMDAFLGQLTGLDKVSILVAATLEDNRR
jgi:hypothetical protein